VKALVPVLLLALAAPAGAASLRRFAVVVGSNDGGPERPRLRFAVSDAAAFAGVLQDLGGVSAADTLLLQEPDRRAFDAGLAQAARQLTAARAPDTRLELVLYYSGHSDETGLLLGREVYRYDELRHALAALPADVRIAVLDSCSSGALTREKGGVRRAPFSIDEASQVRGHAFLTSSSDDESAQESDRVGGSFFTHFLVSGLRGAADVSHDGRVTLTEAYQFAYQETLARTERTRAGPQHAAYDIQLAGTGDLVLTDLREITAGLALDGAVDGRIYVRDAAERLVVELRKQPGRDVEIGLAPGAYRVTLDEGTRLSEAQVQVAAGTRTPLSAARFRPVGREVVATRGGPGETGLRREQLHAAAVPLAADANVEARFALQLPLGRLGRLDGLELSFLGSKIDGDAQGVQLSALGGSVVGGSARGAQLGLIGFGVGGDMRGLQAAVVGNHVHGAVDGVQLAVGAVHAGSWVRGGQAAVGAAVAGGKLEGIQAAVGLATAGEVVGLQTALVAVAGPVQGAQLGLVNVGGAVRGVQLGLVNVAQDVDVPLGLFTWVEKGRMDLEVSSTELHAFHAELHSGSQAFYGILLAAYDPRSDRPSDARVGLGLGGRIRLGILDLDLSATSSNLHRRGADVSANVLVTGKATLGLRVLPGVSLFAGPSLNELVQWDVQTWNPGVSFQSVQMSGDGAIRVFPGFAAGLRLTPHGF
jgi:hypothetical protein